MNWITYGFAALAAFVILVTVHEFGHLLVARRAGVDVLRFSVGMGRPIFKWIDKLGTEWVIGWIPIGGYIKMLDEREFEVPPDLRKRTFNAASPPRRIAIALAGPVANLFLAFVAFWIIMVAGATYPVPTVAPPPNASLAMGAGFTGGEEIVAVDGKSTPTWFHVNLALAERLGETGQIELTVASNRGEAIRVIPINNWLQGRRDANLLQELGLSPSVLPVIKSVQAGSPADRAGLELGDRVVSANGQPVYVWRDLSLLIAENPEREVWLEVERSDSNLEILLVPERKPARRVGVNGDEIGFAGIGGSYDERIIRYSPIEAVSHASRETTQAIGLTVGVLWKMLAGKVAVENLAGPVTIVQVAGQAFQIGWREFLKLLAFLSISLGIINLLPIPVLDGGHVLYAAIELVSRRPLSTKVEMIAGRVGIVLVGALMVVALYSDLTRWFG